MVSLSLSTVWENQSLIECFFCFDKFVLCQKIGKTRAKKRPTLGDEQCPKGNTFLCLCNHSSNSFVQKDSGILWKYGNLIATLDSRYWQTHIDWLFPLLICQSRWLLHLRQANRIQVLLCGVSFSSAFTFIQSHLSLKQAHDLCFVWLPCLVQAIFLAFIICPSSDGEVTTGGHFPTGARTLAPSIDMRNCICSRDPSHWEKDWAALLGGQHYPILQLLLKLFTKVKLYLQSFAYFSFDLLIKYFNVN